MGTTKFLNLCVGGPQAHFQKPQNQPPAPEAQGSIIFLFVLRVHLIGRKGTWGDRVKGTSGLCVGGTETREARLGEYCSEGLGEVAGSGVTRARPPGHRSADRGVTVLCGQSQECPEERGSPWRNHTAGENICSEKNFLSMTIIHAWDRKLGEHGEGNQSHRPQNPAPTVLRAQGGGLGPPGGSRRPGAGRRQQWER